MFVKFLFDLSKLDGLNILDTSAILHNNPTKSEQICHLAQITCYIKEKILLYLGNNCPKILVKFQMCWTCVEYFSLNLA